MEQPFQPLPHKPISFFPTKTHFQLLLSLFIFLQSSKTFHFPPLHQSSELQFHFFGTSTEVKGQSCRFILSVECLGNLLVLCIELIVGECNYLCVNGEFIFF
ncbi:hypothetical protein AAHE18_09G143000 [Arachis hypogaea]